jgi:hypothetical protein
MAPAPCDTPDVAAIRVSLGDEGDTMPHRATTIRPATSGDLHSVTRLAALGRRRRPRGRSLVAEVHGDVVAAIALTSGAVLADPMRVTDDAVQLLKRRRYQVLRQSSDVRPAWGLP